MTLSNIKIKKRNGRIESFDINKIHKVLEWATDGIEDVSISQIEIASSLEIQEGTSTKQIHDILISTSSKLISEEFPNYQYVAASLTIFKLRKEVYGKFEPDTLLDCLEKGVKMGKYDSSILESFSKEEVNYFNNFIKHERDFNFTYIGIHQFQSKYLIKDRVTKKLFETPQIAFMLISMFAFIKYDKDVRKKYVVDFYNMLSNLEISLPTPIMAGLRTPTKQFSSCFPSGSQVYTLNGLKPIEDILEGDLVLTKNGEFNKVIATRVKKYSGGIVSLRNAYSISKDFECTSDHLISRLEWDGYKRKPKSDVPEWVEAKDLKKSDLVHIPHNSRISDLKEINIFEFLNLDSSMYAVEDGYIKKFNIDKNTPRRVPIFSVKESFVPNRIEICEDLMLFLGYFLAEGHLGKKANSITFTFSSREKGYIADVVKIGKSLFNLEGFMHPRKDNSTTVMFHSKIVKDFILSLVGNGFDKKIIHPLLMDVEPSIQKFILIGVIRGDGCIYKNGCTIGMSNRNLIHQLSLICIRNKLYPCLNKRSFSKIDTSLKRIKNVKKTNYLLNLGLSGNFDFLKEVGKNQNVLVKPTMIPRFSMYIGNEFFARISEVIFDEVKEIDVYDLQVMNSPDFTVSGVSVHNCVLLDCADSLDSIIATNGAIIRYASQKAGLGINVGRIRALGSSVKNGEVNHTGLIPFIQMFEKTVHSISQGGVRKGSATLFFPLWHLEVEDLIVLKNNKGSEENRSRNLDYAVQFNKLMYERIQNNSGKNKEDATLKKHITLFSPHDVPDLYESFFNDQVKFKELYEKYEDNPKIRKKIVNADELFSNVLMERNNTGRIYIMNVDHSNTHSSFKEKEATIYQSNLCVSQSSKITVTYDNKIEIISVSDLNSLFQNRKDVQILSFNETSLCNEFKVVMGVQKTGESRDVIKIVCEDKEVVCTPDHKIFTHNRGYVESQDLLYDDIIQINRTGLDYFEYTSPSNGEISIINDNETDDVFDITVEGNSNFYANDILVHNCMEITLPTKPLISLDDKNGQIPLCTLAGINLGAMKNIVSLEYKIELLARCLDSILSYQNYPVNAAKTSTDKYRPLGIGVINFAYYLAKNNLKYTDEASLKATHELFEAIQYYSLKASVKLSKEFGKCEGFDNTKYSEGILPIDTYKKDIDSFAKFDYNFNWDSLRDEIKEYGLRNATLTTLFPSETSSTVSNSIDGVNPVRSFIVYKTSKDGTPAFVVPEYPKLKKKYQFAWDIPNEDLIKVYSIMQKFIDQSISLNTYYDLTKFQNGKIPMSQLKKDILIGYKYGIKTFYYQNTFISDQAPQEDEGCEGGACAL